MREQESRNDELSELLSEEISLFDLSDWDIDCRWAKQEEIGMLRMQEARAGVFIEDEKKAKIIIDREACFGDYSARRIIDHELAHLLINSGKVSPTGFDVEHAQACHIDYAIHQLRVCPQNYIIRTNTLEEIVERSRKLARLSDEDEGNDWRIIVERKDLILDHGVRIPVFIKNQFGDSGLHIAVVGTRQAILYVDELFAIQNGLDLPKLVLGEMWRIVLLPYKDGRFNTHTYQIDRILKIMDKLGWRKGVLYD